MEKAAPTAVARKRESDGIAGSRPRNRTAGTLSSTAGANPEPLTDSRSSISATGDGRENRLSFLLSSSAPRFAPTLLVLKIGSCNFPSEISPSLSFPLLKQLILRCVSISEDVFDQVLSGCRALESLQLWDILTARRLHIRSLTLRSIGFRARSACTQELVIEDAPSLERFVSLYSPDISFETIRVIGAPKLKILGLFSPCVSTLQIATLVIKGVSPVSLANSICTVKVLALYSSGSQLNAVLNILRCFPRLEKLYFTLKHPKMDMKNVRLCDPLDPIECLAIHLKKLVFENYKGRDQDADFAKFFILNAKVLKEIKISSPKGNDIQWVDDQHRLLQVEDRASRDAEPEFRSEFSCLGKTKQIHDLLDNPFDCSCSRIKCNVLSGEACP
ncbi:putative F-box/FBD/LRR-repeat protein At5g56810 [Triticum aestivum]|uniref:putative F-box/FBD/LRR-repeat protein At5g56810 n=1 Tax=Triticum aestivum TaxID=4565 RepID=UPI001D0249F8|nr:putative F-box/FBD/LRR-repeat protein At5g56810 [Triticum aestivum]